MKISIKTFGCSANLHDAEVMAGLLSEKGHIIIEDCTDSDILILNICTVKGETKALREIRKNMNEYFISGKNRIIVTGCITPELEQGIKNLSTEISVLDTLNIQKIAELVDGIDFEKSGKEIKIGFNKIRKNNIIGVVPISSGCLNSCSYCSVKILKGSLFSYPLNDIVIEVEKNLAEGCKEIWITSQDNSAWGVDIYKKPMLPELLKDIISIDGDFFVRIGMMNPDNVLLMVDELIDVFRNDKIFKFLHLPVQSGNDRILKLMNRKYSVEEFEKIVVRFRKKIPDITISTDIICGFPTESEEEFLDSLDLIKKIKPDIVNISRFIIRQGTDASKMEQFPSWIVKERTRKLTKVCDDIFFNNNNKWVGWQGKILVDEIGKAGTLIGRNIYYKPVIFRDAKIKLGEFAELKVTGVTKNDLRAF